MNMHIRGQKGFSAVEAIIIVVVLALAGFGGWYVFNKQKSDDKNNTNAAATTPKTIDVKQLVGDIKTAVGDKYTTVSQEDTPGYGWFIDYVADGYAFKTRADGDAHVMFTDKASWPIDYRAKPIPAGVGQAVVKAIKDKGGLEVVHPPINVTSIYGSAAKVAYYSFKNAVCITVEDKTTVTMYTLNCANLEDFVDVAKAAQPFFAPIAQGSSVKENNLILGMPVIHAGATAGTEYAAETILTPQYGATAYLYRKTGEQAWHYYVASQEGLACAQLTNNADAQATFKGICQTGGF